MQRVASLSITWLLLLSLGVPFAGCAPVYASPEIVSLEARNRVIAPGDSVLIECIAVGQNSKELTYEWSADRGTVNGYAGVIAWTAPEQEGVARITVTVSDGAAEPASQSIAVIVKRNIRPVITGLTSSHDWVYPGEAATIRCEAEDPDGDELSYMWSADCGELTGEGSTVTWTAPNEEGKCTIDVLVDDGYEGRTTTSISVVVSSHEPLIVKDMVVTAADDPNYLMFYTNRYKIYRGDSMIIRAVVNEPDHVVSYEWTDGGPAVEFPVGGDRIAFEGGPAEIRWTSPQERGEYVITVTARGEGDKLAMRSIVVLVETCLCGFPDPD